MSALLAMITAQAGAMLMSYVGTEVGGRLTEKWWGRGIVGIVKLFTGGGKESAAEGLIKALAAEGLTPEQEARLTPEQLATINHGAVTGPGTTREHKGG